MLTWGRNSSNIGREINTEKPVLLEIDGVTSVSMGKSHSAIVDSSPQFIQARETYTLLDMAKRGLLETEPSLIGRLGQLASSSTVEASRMSSAVSTILLSAPRKEKSTHGVKMSLISMSATKVQ